MTGLDLPHSIRLRGSTIRWGKIGQGPDLVAIHGTPFSAQVWRRIAPVLARDFTVHYFDLAGYGQSEMRAGQDVSLGVQNLILCDLFDLWGLDRPHVLAHDFGGATALRAYFLNGLRYGGLTLFDAVALSPWGSPLVQHVRQHEAAFAGMPGYMHHAVLRAYLETAAHHPLTPEALDIYMTPWLGPVGQPAFYRQIAQMDQRHTDEVETLYTWMDCKVTVLWGTEDQWIPHQMGERLAALITDRALISVPGSGHLMQEDCPEAIVAAVLRG